jgi:hypothetical protein
MADEKPKTSLRTLSKCDWSLPAGTDLPDDERIQLGCLLRIADATELMASNYIRLQNEVEQYKRWHAEEANRNKRLRKDYACLQGQNTKLKNKIKALTTKAE